MSDARAASISTEKVQTRLPPAQRPVWLLAAAGVLLLALAATQTGGWRLGIAAILGALGGFALYHASFGFTSGWRHFIIARKGAGLRAQLLLIALLVTAGFPLIGWGNQWGLHVGGYIFPFGVAAAFGAFIFGLGMQLGGGCASGTLYTVGGGSTRMVITLMAFIFGSVLATAHLPDWQQLPRLPAMSLIWSFGPALALMIALVVIGGLTWLTIFLERRRYGALEARGPSGPILHGPWPKMTGALVLAAMAFGTLIVLGRPWGITSAFALWGAKIGDVLEFGVAEWAFWNHSGALHVPVLADATSVQNFGIILGAFMAAGLAGRFAPVWRIGFGPFMAAIIGGVMMGYGARLAFGCNIGALLGGLTSGSLHGVGWLIFGFLGSIIGVRLRPLFRLD